VEEGNGVGGEQLAFAAGVAEAETEVLGGVGGGERLDLEAVMKARVERAVAAQGETIAELREADEHEGEESAAVPLVVEQDVEVVEGVLVQEVGFVEEEDGMDALAGELLDVRGHGVEKVAGGGGGRQPEGEAELAVEVAAAERGVVRVGQAVAGSGDAVTDRAQDAGLADAGFADEHHRGPLGERVEETIGHGLLGAGQPEGERLVEKVVRIIKTWGHAGVEALLRLMDEQEVDDHYDFCGLVEARCRRDPDFRVEVQRRASAGNRASGFAMENLRREEEGRDVDGFLAELRATVLPENWLTLSACVPAEPVRLWSSALHFDEPTLARILEEEPERLHTKLDAWGFSPNQRSALQRWFSNFTQDAHRSLAEKLFWNLDYYSSERFTETLKLRHQDLLRMLAERGLGGRRILLVTPGGVDSGQRHAYDLAKQWGLLHDQFCELSALSEQMTSERVVVWFNDTHGSGNQFLRDIWPKLSPLLSNAAAFVIVAVAMAREARARFQREIPDALLIPREDARTAAEVLTGEELRCAKEIGLRLDAKRPLGYGGTALIVAYYFQCPNNSLPLLWKQQDEGLLTAPGIRREMTVAP
jgi:hypothetical protein